MSTPTPAGPQVRYGLLEVHVALQLQDAAGGATGSARSGLCADGRRGIRIWLAPAHLLVSRALHRADALTIRFLVGLALVEFCAFWVGTRDGAAVTRAFKRLAGIPPGQQAWGSGFASRLACSEPLRVVDTLPIFSRSPQTGSFDLFTLTIEGRTPSDVPNWRLRDDEAEDVRPIPPKSKVKPPMVAPAVVVPVPDPFLGTFHDRAKELLSADDYNLIVEMTKEEVARGC